MRRLNKDSDTLCMSWSRVDMHKVVEAGHKALLTEAIASEKVGKDFLYQLAERTEGRLSIC